MDAAPAAKLAQALDEILRCVLVGLQPELAEGDFLHRAALGIDEPQVAVGGGIQLLGREDLDDIEKIKRLQQWCDDVNANQKNAKYRMLYIKQEEWEALAQKPRNFGEVVRGWST